jgi:hypothetical protein
MWLGHDPVAGSFEQSNELSTTQKARKFLGQLNDHQLLKRECAPWIYLAISVQQWRIYLQILNETRCD